MPSRMVWTSPIILDCKTCYHEHDLFLCLKQGLCRCPIGESFYVAYPVDACFRRRSYRGFMYGIIPIAQCGYISSLFISYLPAFQPLSVACYTTLSPPFFTADRFDSIKHLVTPQTLQPIILLHFTFTLFDHTKYPPLTTHNSSYTIQPNPPSLSPYTPQSPPPFPPRHQHRLPDPLSYTHTHTHFTP